MKALFKILILFFSINTSLLAIPETKAQSISLQVFYDDLSPYGNWIESPEYGYVWSPRISGFTPYSTNGYWILTDFGWTWVSNYSWGWAPFHYGRWYYDSFYGYVWVPGYEWGPGWVTWRRSNDYYGWAPIGPGISMQMAYSNSYNIPYNHWNFVRCNDFGRRDIHNHYIDRSRNVTIINNTTVINNTKVDKSRKVTFNAGPDRMEVQRKVGKSINPIAVVDEKSPAQRITKNSVELYRPVVKNNAVNKEGKKPAPAKLTPVSEMKEQANVNRNRKETPAVKEEADGKNELNQLGKPMRDDKQNPQVKRAPVNESPVRDNNPERKNENNNATEQPVKKQPGRKPVRDEPLQQPQREKAKQQPEKMQPEQRHPDNQRNTDQPVQPRPQQKVEQPQRRQDDRPVQKPQQRQIERPVPQQHQRQVERPAPQPQQRQTQRPVQQPQQRPHSSANGKAHRPAS